MFELLVVGSIGFWVLLGLEFIVLLALTEYERPGWGIFSIVVVGLLLRFFGGIGVFDYVWNNPRLILFYFLGYLVAGIAWAVVKWWFFVRDQKEKYLAAKENFFSSRTGQSPDLTKREWIGSREYRSLLNSKDGIAPLARDNKRRITMWMIYWPWSLLWTLVNDAVKRLYKEIYEAIHKFLQNISDSVFKGVE